MSRVKRALLFALALLPIGIVGGWFTTQYTYAGLDPEILRQGIEQAGSYEALVAIGIIQAVLYAVAFGFFGYIISDKIGLMKRFRFEKKPLIIVIAISVALGAVFSLDAWTFSVWIPELNGSYSAAGSFDLPTWATSILYGGVIEEVMMRLFFLSLIALIVWKLFFRKREEVPTGVLIGANIAAAMLFAAGHLPATATLIGKLTPMLVFRCFLLNGLFGLFFGRFYRKYGIQYAMLAHMLLHIVARSIWLIAF